MNLLFLSSGRRYKLLEYFTKEFEGFGKIIAVDYDRLAPSLYVADNYYNVPKIDDERYIDIIKDICKRENIKGIISLIDPELSILARHIDDFKEMGVTCFLSNYESIEICFNKYQMYKFLTDNNFKCAKTYIDFEEFKNDYTLRKINFPVIVKPICGSASIGINKVYTLEEVEFLLGKFPNLIIQDYLDGIEIGVDAYVDMISKETVSIFAKEKIRLRSGETDKSKSYKSDKLFNLVIELISDLKLVGPIDIDMFKIGNEYYISEINPRFGGGYPHAYECGEDFTKLIRNNLSGVENKKNIGTYKDEIYAIKYDDILIKYV